MSRRDKVQDRGGRGKKQGVATTREAPVYLLHVDNVETQASVFSVCFKTYIFAQHVISCASSVSLKALEVLEPRVPPSGPALSPSLHCQRLGDQLQRSATPGTHPARDCVTIPAVGWGGWKGPEYLTCTLSLLR